MNFTQYQNLAAITMPDSHDNLASFALGLAGETGEVVELVKKHLGHGHELDPSKLQKELGDVLWYVAAIATTLELDLDAIAEQNITKLKARYPQGFSHEASRNREVES